MTATRGGPNLRETAPSDEDASVTGHSIDTVITPPIVVVDPADRDHGAPNLVESVAQLVSRKGYNVSIVCGGGVETTLTECEKHKASIVLLPLSLPADGRSLTSALSTWEAPAVLCAGLVERRISVIAVSLGAPAALLAACVTNGAFGIGNGGDLSCFLRDLHGEIRSNGVRSAVQVRLQSLLNQRPLSSGFSALLTLTSTERRILNAMMLGRSASDIASALVVSLTTVRTHIRSILGKLDVSSQISAVAIGYGIEVTELLSS